jgi:hypothetical protein
VARVRVARSVGAGPEEVARVRQGAGTRCWSLGVKLLWWLWQLRWREERRRKAAAEAAAEAAVEARRARAGEDGAARLRAGAHGGGGAVARRGRRGCGDSAIAQCSGFRRVRAAADEKKTRDPIERLKG